MKISRKVREAFEFYALVWECMDCGIYQEEKWIYPSLAGSSSLEVFAMLESTGYTMRTREPAKLRQVLRAKAELNLHIKMWAEGIAEWTLFVWELREDPKLQWIIPWSWVWGAIDQQAKKIRYGKA